MTSTVLYRKWRSQTFNEIIGQEHVVQTLRNAISEGRVGHAYLFTGPRGVGKTSMARLLAKAVNCTAPLIERPCGACSSCRAITEGRAVDVIEMDAASHTSVDDARDLIERVQFRPASAKYKVYTIDEVHMLSTAAFNALLKTLEEPPDHALFILATTEIHKIPATILSRCQRFSFTRHTISATAKHLQEIAAKEQLTLEPGVGEAIARAATGSMRDALGILEQLISFANGQIKLEHVHSLLGMTTATEVNLLIDALLQKEIGKALHSVQSIAEQGADLRQFTRDLVERLRSLLLLISTKDKSLLDGSDDDLAQLEKWTNLVHPATLVQWLKLFSALDLQLRTSSYGHLPLELALVEALVAPAPVAAQPVLPAQPVQRAAPPSELKPRLLPQSIAPEPERELSPASEKEEKEDLPAAPAAPHPIAEAKQPETGPASSEKGFSLDHVIAAWPSILDDVKQSDKMLYSVLRDVQPFQIDGLVLTLQAGDFHRKQVEKKLLLLETIVRKRFGLNITLQFQTGSKPLSTKNPVSSKSKPASALTVNCGQDDLVEAARDIFDAKTE